nr:MAG TPA: hypothetical protein [Caudoviricetes sp.]
MVVASVARPDADTPHHPSPPRARETPPVAVTGGVS